ncbi:MAG: helix-turn-helix domain-containing protein [Acetatifactor sp.]|nr:helix-turn-helix domain-containing protein [Acetatifactor sp.]
MESIKHYGVAMGGKIYSLRMAKRMSQEQLAAVLNISPAAVSKWERNLSNPSVEMLWALADLFECSIDELVGRTLVPVESVGIYDEKKLRLVVIGEDLLKCSEISRAEGLLAMESYVPRLKGGSRFLAFAIPYILNLFMKQLESEEAFRFLENYVATLPEAERPEGSMIAAVLRKIFSGESPEILQELIASYIGIDYREKNGRMSEMLKYARQEILDQYMDKKIYSDNTDLLEELVHVGDFEIQLILRNLDTVTLTAALTGASGEVVRAFLANLSDRVLYFIHEDMKQWNGTEEEILAAQKKVLALHCDIQSTL